MKRRIGIMVVLALVLSLGILAVASAHAKLVSSDPASGAKLTAAPSKVTLVFSEEISDKADESNVTVTDEQGNEVGKGGLDTTDLDHKTQSATLKSGLGDGIYTVKWNALTPDDKGHSEGSFTFGVNKDPGAQPTAAPDHDEDEMTPTAATSGTAKPTAAATSSTAQPTAATAGGSKPGTLPKTGEGDSSPSLYLLVGALLVLICGLVLRRSRGSARR